MMRIEPRCSTMNSRPSPPCCKSTGLRRPVTTGAQRTRAGSGKSTTAPVGLGAAEGGGGSGGAGGGESVGEEVSGRKGVGEANGVCPKESEQARVVTSKVNQVRKRRKGILPVEVVTIVA